MKQQIPLNAAHRSRFVILTLPRSGSYHLASLLGSAPDITCLGEIFKPNKIELPPPLAASTGFAEGDVGRRDADPRGYLGQIMRDSAQPIFGFKEFPANLGRVRLRKAIIYAPAWQKIFLTRNPLRRYLSRHRTMVTGLFVRMSADQHDHDSLVVPFEPELFAMMLQESRNLDALVSQLREDQPGRVLAVDYRDLSAPDMLASVLEFLGSEADPATLSSRYFRQNIARFEDSFEDFDLVVRYMRENGLEEMLEDALHPGA